MIKKIIKSIDKLATSIGEFVIRSVKILVKIVRQPKQTNFRQILLKKKAFIPALFIILCLGPAAYLLTKNPNLAQADWWDDGWMYRKAVEITNAGSEQTYFQVMITLDTESLIDDGKMQEDCDDIRITDINGKTLPHWVEEYPTTNACNQTTTKIWTKLPNISTSGTTVYLYYGNTTIENRENGSNVFIFFDGQIDDLQVFN